MGYCIYMTTTAAQTIKTLTAQFEAGEIDKFDFYDATMNYPAKLVADVSGININVVKDRRRYLRQLEKDMRKNRTEKLAEALALAITAPSDEKAGEAVAIAEQIANTLTEIEVAQAKKQAQELVAASA